MPSGAVRCGAEAAAGQDKGMKLSCKKKKNDFRALKSNQTPQKTQKSMFRQVQQDKFLPRWSGLGCKHATVTG